MKESYQINRVESQNVRDPLVGIVIVSYNAATAVRATLAGVRHARNTTASKVILVDNASDDLAREKIHSAFMRHVQEALLPWEYLQQDKNLGFSGGNNVGITRFLVDPEISHICLLNADVIVADHWLDHLIETGCDIVSAVTNKADSEQCIPVDYVLELNKCLDESTERLRSEPLSCINTFTQDWRKAWQGNLVEVDVTFFCVLIATPAIRKIGLLDEVFFPGGYEDDDYCLRARKLGYKIHLARDVFIHHWGSASFGQLQHEYFNDRAQRNREYLEKKHGITWRKRPEKPFISYLMDIQFACTNDGNSSLRRRFNNLYTTQLGGLLECYESEFNNLQLMVMNSGLALEMTLKDQLQHAQSFGDLSRSFKTLAVEAEKIFTLGSPTHSSAQDLITRFEHLVEGIRIQVGCNFAMHAFISAHAKELELKMLTPNAGSKLGRLSKLLKQSIPFLRNLHGIVFFGGYPYPERQSDGYFQRIQMIDGLFTDRWRVYVESESLPGRSHWYDRPQPNVLVLRILGGAHRRTLVRLLALIAVLKCRKIYFHSVLRMRDNRFGWLMHVPGLTKVIDIHGVVPEEFRLHNDFYSAVLYEREERLAVRKSDMVIVVTDAMQTYLRQKYRNDLQGRVVIFPMFPSVAPTLAPRTYVNGKPVVVYAGGLHKWQQVPKMIDAITRTAAICAHRFYSPDPDIVRAMLPEAIRDQVIVDRKSHEELISLYSECHYGFILREDNVVNHVSCPTKLVEYLAMGIVPIVDCDNIGDFKAMGMQYVSLSALLQEQLPEESRRAQMAEANFRIYERLREVRKLGAHDIYAQCFDGQHFRNIFPMLRAWAKRLLPFDTYRGRFARVLWHFMSIPLSQRKGVETAIQIDASIPSECDVLVQVDNFEAGGLENVVLDLNETLIQAGYKVVFLVLGIAGKGVQRARECGAPVVVGSPEGKSYRAIIERLKPRLLLTHYSLHGAELCHQKGIPFIQVIHNTYMWFDDAQRAAFAEAAHFTSAFVAVSEYVKRYSISRLGIEESRCIVIPNGIDSAVFDDLDMSEARREIRTKHGLDDQDFVFLSVGSINHQKNHIATVRAFSVVADKLPKTKLVILGPAYEKSLLEEIECFVEAHGLNEQVIYAGAVLGAQKYYAMADAFVSAAFFEGAALSTMEAARANLPSVMSSVGTACNFLGLPGFDIIDAPLDIIEFEGDIRQLVSSSLFEERLAVAMIRLYTSRQRPNLTPSVLNAFDKSFAYQCYVELIEDVLQGKNVSGKSFPSSWPNRLAAVMSEQTNVTA